MREGGRNPLVLAIGVMAAVAMLGDAYLLATRDDDRPKARVLGRQRISPPPVALSPAPQIVITFPPAPASSEAPADASPSAAPSPAEPAGSCLNSSDPRCGRSLWMPAPGRNAPMKIDVELNPAEPQPGDEVTFTVTVTDPDARISALEAGYGDPHAARRVICDPPPRYGAWTTPRREPGKLVRTFTHTYAKPGRYVASFFATSGSVCGSPYGNALEIDVAIDVRAG